MGDECDLYLWGGEPPTPTCSVLQQSEGVQEKMIVVIFILLSLSSVFWQLSGM